MDGSGSSMQALPPPGGDRAEGDSALAPLAASFAEYPASWYYFAPVNRLRRRPVSRTMLGRELVAFRTAGGRVGVLDARCSHLGADLGKGCVVGESIRCPYHNWEYAADGRCVRIPAQDHIPPLARQRGYPVEVQHGHVFFFNGPKPLFGLPFFPGERSEDFAAARPLRFHGDFSWYMFAANTFDVQHWHGIHSRRLIGDPKVDCPNRYARRTRFRARVVGRSFCDRLTRWFAGSVVEFDITNWGGTIMLVTASFGRVCSYGVICSQPQ